MAAGRFFAGGWVSSAPCEGAWLVVGAAGSVVLWLGFELAVVVWALVEVLELGPSALSSAWVPSPTLLA